MKRANYSLIQACVGLFFISTSLLMVEILSTRVAKILFGYNFQFIILSWAILGVGLGGIIVFLYYSGKKKDHVQTLNFLSIVYPLLVLVPFIANQTKHFFGIQDEKAIFFLSLFVVYIFCGAIISIIFKKHSQKIHLLYTISMLGSAVGCFFIVVFLNQFGNEITILLTISTAILAAFTLNKSSKFSKILLLGGYTLFLIYGFVVPQALVKINCRNDFNPWYGPFKNTSPIYKESNAISYLETYKIDQGVFRILIDCIGTTTGVDMEIIKSKSVIEKSTFYFPYYFKRYNSALILGSGGGVEASRAVDAGVSEIDAVEINPLMIKRMDLLVKGLGNVYNHPAVTLYVEEARNFVIKNKGEYSLIHIGNMKRYGGLGLKDFVFLANYIYTKEAFRSYIDHLNEDGVLFIGNLKSFTERYISTLISVLSEKSINLEESVVIVSKTKEVVSGIFVKKNGFSQSEKERLYDIAERNQFHLFELDPKAIEKVKNAPVIVDDNPYYWNASQMELFSGNNFRETRFTSIESLVKLFLIILLFYIGVVVIGYFKNTGVSKKKVITQIAYFSSIGIGYMILELTFINKFTLLLVNPTLAISVILFSLLVFNAIGSYISRNMHPSVITKVITLLVAYIFVYAFVVDMLLERIFIFDLWARIISAILLLFLPGLLMGMLFPLGLKLAAKISPNYIPYFWGINGITTIMGSVIAMFISLVFGFKIAFLVGAVFYLLAIQIRKIVV